MAKKYENVEKIIGLLDDTQLGNLQKRLYSTEKSLSDILKKLSVLETEKAEREAEALLKAQEEARLQEEAKKAEEEKAMNVAETPEEKPVKKTAKKKEEKVEETPAEEPVVAEETVVPETKAEEPVQVKEVAEEKENKEEKAENRTFVPKTDAPAAPRAPRYFRNGQEQGVYVAKPGTENTGATTYRPRPTGDRPFTPKPATGRPVGTARPARPTAGATPVVAAPIAPSRDSKNFTAPAKKKTFEKTYTEKKPLSKRTLIKQQGMTVEDFDEDKSGYRKVRSPKKQKRQEIPTIKIEHAVVTTQEIPLKVLSEKLGVSAVEITKRLFKEGNMKGINDSIDYDNAALMAADMGIDLEYKPEKTAEESRIVAMSFCGPRSCSMELSS